MEVKVVLPRLATVGREAWKKFKEQFLSYQKRDEDAEIRTYMTDTVWTIYQARTGLADGEDSDVILEEIDKLYGITNRLTCVYALEEFKLKGITEKEISEYVINYQRVIRSVTTSVERPKDEQIQKLFLKGIINPRFRTRVATGLSTVTEPEFTDVIRIVFEEGLTVEEDIQDMAGYVTSTGTTKRKKKCPVCGKIGHDERDCWIKHPELKKKKRSKGSTAPRRPKKPLSEIQCYKCREMGHYANNCPNEKKDREEGSIKALVGDGLPTYEIMIFNGKDPKKTVKALIDSGSSHSVISEEVLSSMGTELQLLPCDVLFHLATGEPIRSKMRARMTVRIKGAMGKFLRFTTWFYGIPMTKAATPVLLGRDFIEETDWNHLAIRDPVGSTVIKDVAEDGLFEDEIKREEDSLVEGIDNEEIRKLLEEYEVAIKDVELCRARPFRIELKEKDVVISDVPRRLSPKRREILEQLLQELLDKKFIRRSKSPYASPIVLVPKKNGSFRLCVDYRVLNEHIVPIRYP
ncbi:LDOC1-related like protein, partial [Aduncisulcus paluster]